jgi:hypothetical protein
MKKKKTKIKKENEKKIKKKIKKKRIARGAANVYASSVSSFL